jgi:hypothetical protein
MGGGRGWSHFESVIFFLCLIFKRSMGARNRVGIGLSYRPARFFGIDSWASLKFKNSGSVLVKRLRD